MPTCPYHGGNQPCRTCLIKRMGEFAHHRQGNCPYHGDAHPCLTCFDKQMGEFAHAVKPKLSAPYIPPHKFIHFKQSKKDTCAVACCGMVGAFLECPKRFTLEDLELYMTERGVYVPGDQSFFHALDQPLEWLGLHCKEVFVNGVDTVADALKGSCVLILETVKHVIVIFRVNSDGTLTIGDPAMSKTEMSVDATDYRLLKLKGRAWCVWKL